MMKRRKISVPLPLKKDTELPQRLFASKGPEREYYQYDRKGGTSEIDKFKRETGEK